MPATTPPERASPLLLAAPVLAALGSPLLLADVGVTLLVTGALGSAAFAQSPGQLLDGFDSSSTEDASAFRRDERALWGRGSALSATTHFAGTGGPGGNFVWVIQSGETFEFDTTSTVITSADLATTQLAVGGIVDVQELFIHSGGVLRIRGPNPFVLRATHRVDVFGRIVASGVDHPSYSQFNTGFPSPGSVGGPGGGRGGSSSLNPTQSTARGETGYGAWNVALGGGTGGETGYNGSTNYELRRGSGGGGGRFGADLRSSSTGCPLQTWIGLDVEQGGPGELWANGAVGGLGVRPAPGVPNASPFTDGDPTNDFWGQMTTLAGATIVGELSRPWAGAGGGAGGDCVPSYTFPNPNFAPWSDEVGGGGGGGGGSMLIQSLGSVVLSSGAVIEVDGGTGGGGENSSGLNHVGPAGGGGSGGHLILQASRLGWYGGATLSALGGQGGSGANNVGGAQPGGVSTSPALDSINLVAPYDPSCLVPAPQYTNVVGSGGDGGPGIIQLHATEASEFTALGPLQAQPTPVGVGNVVDPTTWDLLDLPFGPESMSRSRWSHVAGSGPIDVRFAGTDASGFVIATLFGRVTRLPTISSGTISASPSAPYVDVDGRTLVIAATSIIDPVWSDPAHLVGAELALASGPILTRFDVESATAVGATLRLTVAGAGTPLAPFATGSTYDLAPRAFRVATDGVRDYLPVQTCTIRIEFQGAPDDGTGVPDMALASAWSPDANALESVPGLAFVRFQVEFDMQAGFPGLTIYSARPSLEFLRIPYLR